MDYRVISSDDHIDLTWLPPDLWQKRVPAAFKDRAPRVVEMNGQPMWMCDGLTWIRWGPGKTGTTANGRPQVLQITGDRPEDMRPANPELRLADMDTDGVDASVIFGPLSNMKFQDPELRVVCYRAYNDWLVEFCTAQPERLLGAGMLPRDNPKEAARELKRLAGMGLRAATLPITGARPFIYEPDWEPLWEAASDYNVPISSHFFNDVTATDPEPARNALGGWGARLTFEPVTQLDPLAGLIFGGIFERFPNLQVHLAETGIGWMPFALERMDHLYEQCQASKPMWDKRSGGYHLTMAPSEYFKRHVRITFQEDRAGLALFSFLGEDTIMWASDYPHADSTWPHSQETIERDLAFLPAAARRKVACDNARALYHLSGTTAV